MSELRTDYKDEILQEGEEHRVYNIKRKGTDEVVESEVYLEKTYEPLQEGDEYGAKDINELNGIVNVLAQDNLLTNSDFKSGIINQKGKTSYVVGTSSYIYTIDMWKTKGMTVTVNANSVTIKNSSGSSQVFQQIFTKPSDDYMAVVNVLSVTGNTYIDINNVKSSKLIQGLNNFEYTGEIGFFSIRVDNGATIQIEFMKLEKGSFFTGMPVWNEASELLKCKSKFRKIPQSFFGYGMSHYLFIITDTEDMDKIPSVYQVNTGMDYSVVLFADTTKTEYLLTAEITKLFGNGYLRIDIGTGAWNNWRFTGYFKDCDIFADSYDY